MRIKRKKKDDVDDDERADRSFYTEMICTSFVVMFVRIYSSRRRRRALSILLMIFNDSVGICHRTNNIFHDAIRFL